MEVTTVIFFFFFLLYYLKGSRGRRLDGHQ